MAGGRCHVKESVQPHVAQQFADAGLAAIRFDRGTSARATPSAPTTDPNAQIEDYRNAMSFAETLDEAVVFLLDIAPGPCFTRSPTR
jgi:hypothetical protein